jgi:hypothetical protein
VQVDSELWTTEIEQEVRAWTYDRVVPVKLRGADHLSMLVTSTCSLEDVRIMYHVAFLMLHLADSGGAAYATEVIMLFK